MVYLMAESQEFVKVDKQGRLVLPARIRKSLGLNAGGLVSIKRDGSKVVIEPKLTAGLEGRVNRWAKETLQMKAKMFSDHARVNDEKSIDSMSWMSREYAKRKLGIR